MNSLAWLAGFIASLWIADYFYGVSESALGFAALGIALICLAILVFAIRDDYHIFMGARRGDDD